MGDRHSAPRRGGPGPGDASRSQRSRLALVAVVLAVVTLVVHARVVLGGMTWDDVRYHTEIAPPRLAAAEAVLAGEAPTWWEGTGLGVPLLGEPSHGAAYPPGWFAATPRLLDLFAVLHLFWLALGIALWARRLGASELAALVAGVAVGASGIAVGAGLRGALPALAHLPWVGWAALTLAAAPGRTLARSTGASAGTDAAPDARRAAAILGLALGAIGLSGELAIFVDALLLAALSASRAQLRWFAAAFAGGLAIAAAQWIPALAIASDSAGATLGALKPSRLLELVLPGSFGSTTGEHAVAPIAGTLAYLPSLYLGAPVLALAALARPGQRMIALATVLVVLALVVGRGGGWPAWLGAPDLHLAVLGVLAAAHAGLGVDALVARQRRALVALGGAAIVTALALAAASVLRSRVEAEPLDRALLEGGLALACIVAAIAIAWRTRISVPLAAHRAGMGDEGDSPAVRRDEGRVDDDRFARRRGVPARAAGPDGALAWSSVALAVLLVAPSVGSLGSTAPVIGRAIVETPPLWATAALGTRDVTNPRAPLRVYRPISFYEEEPDRSVDDSLATLIGSSPARYGLGAARSEDPARPVIHDRLWLAASSVGSSLLERYGISLAILPASVVQGRRGTDDHDHHDHDGGGTTAGPGADSQSDRSSTGELARRGNWALAKLAASPPAAMVFEWIWFADDAAAIARLFPAGAKTGLFSGLTILRGTGPEQQEEPRVPEPCTISRWARGAIDMTCAAQEPSYAVVSSTSAQGWTVEVGGKDTPWVTADVMRRAVALPPGAQVVSWRYTAPGLFAGVLVALAGVLALLGLLAHSVIRRPRIEPDRDQS